jgi:DNA-directed RNA polymerase specialized sigma24 family protein
VSETYAVRAVRWDGGWELHIAGVGVTQVRVLSRAAAQARDYLATAKGGEPDEYTVTVSPDLGGIEDEVAAVRRESAAAAEAQVRAGEHSRAVVRSLRAQGLSYADTAAVLGVTPARVQQLAAG